MVENAHHMFLFFTFVFTEATISDVWLFCLINTLNYLLIVKISTTINRCTLKCV